MEVTEGIAIKGFGLVEEINPKTGEVVSTEKIGNVICVNGATTIAWTMASAATSVTFNFMVLSTDATAAARASTAISPQTAVSTEITPTKSGSITTWIHTFAAGGSASIAKFGMQSTATGGLLWNEYVFSALKDNATNDLKITYNASFAP